MRKNIALNTLVLAFSAGGISAHVSAQPGGAVAAPVGIEEITVQARRREESVQDVPISIVAFDASEILNNRMENMYTLADMVPNLEVRGIYPNSMPAIYMRGVGTNDYAPSASSAVGLYVDGVYRSLLAGALFQTFDTERVEVLKGPQGTLYGKNTTGGSINFFSVLPGEEFGGHFKAGIGNYDSREFEGAVDIPIAEDLTSRVSFVRQQSDGYIKDHYPGGADDFMGDDNWAARTLLRYTPGENVRVLLKVYGGEIDTDYAAPSRGLFDPATLDARTFYAEPCQDDVFSFRCADFSGYVARGLYDVEQNGPGMEAVDMFGGSAQVDWDMETAVGDVTLTSITGYDKVERETFNDSEAGPYVFADGIGSDDSYQLSQEFRATGDSGPVVWVVGAYAFQSVVEASTAFQFPPDGGLGGDYGWWTLSDAEDRIETNNYAFFGESTYSVTERSRITGGLRYNWEKKESRQSEYRYVQYSETPDLGTPQGTPCGPDASQFDPANCPPGRRESESWSDWSGNVTFDYDVADDVMLFASYKRGFKSGGFSTPLTTCEFTCFGSYAPGPPWDGTRGDGTMLDSTFDPETLDSYEIGMKSMWLDRRLQLNVNAFYYDYQDLQVFTLIAAGGTFIQVTQNASDAEIKGVEIDLLTLPVSGLEIRVGAAWLDATYGDYTDAPQGDLSGNTMVNAPEYSGNVSVSYEFDVSEGALRAFLGATYTDESFFSADNIERLKGKSVWELNGNLNYVFPDERLAISVWGRNLTDEKYVSHGFDASGLGYDQLVASQPRTYGINFTYTFGAD